MVENAFATCLYNENTYSLHIAQSIKKYVPISTAVALIYPRLHKHSAKKGEKQFIVQIDTRSVHKPPRPAEGEGTK